MKTPNTTPTTRASLLTTASCNNRWFASLLASTAVLGSAALATDWVGDTSTDWNDPLNWSGDAGTGGSNAFINIASPTATISSNTLANPVDIFVGNGGGSNGRLDHTAGVASTGGGNWMFVGRDGGTGVYNLADTAGSGGTYTGMGQGTGTMNATGRLYVGGDAAAGSNGTVNVHTTGALAISSELNIGTNASVGVMNVDSGTVTNNNWLRVGAGNGSTGTLRISGGSVTKAGNDHLIVGDNAGSSGTITLDAGSLTVNNECWIGQAGGTGVVNINGGTLTNNSWVAIGRDNINSHGTVNHTGGTWNKTGGGRFIIGDNSVGTYNLSGTGALAINDEFWVGQGGNGNGTLVMSGGSITSNNWVAVGRDGGTATVTMSGGTWTKTGGGAYIIGASGPATFAHTGGLIDVQSGDTWMGENGNCTYTLSGTGEVTATYFQVARNGASTSNVSLNGGTLRANQIVGGGGTENVSFNGTQIIARVDQTNFIGGMDAAGATIDAGGLLVNSNGFTLTAPQSFDGTGGVVKTGAGSLALTGGNSYTGNNVLSAGTLTLSASGSGTGSITTADGTTLGITAPFAGEQLTASAVTLGTSAATTLNLNLGDVVGVNPTNSILDVTGALTVNGPVTVNVAGAKFAVGDIPLVSYNAANLTGAGAGAITLGTLPSGVVATVVTDPNYFGAGLGAVYLDITSVALPEWDGTNEVVLSLTGDTVATSADVTVVNATGIVIGQVVRGAGIPTGATVSAITGLTITLDQAATATATFVDLDFVVTAGTNEGLWDTTTQNWIDQVTTLSSLYADPNPALFSDLATGPTAVVLNVTVNPSEVTFNNSTLAYSLSGTGAIAGSTGLLKQGTASLGIDTTNSYTGITRLEGGTTTVSTLTNGGVASPLGAASSTPSNLVLAGGTLGYTGGAVSIDRGLTIDGNSALVNAGNLSVSGQVLRISGGITKTGAGSLTLSNASNSLGDFRVNEGSLAFDGSGGPQTNTAAGLFLGAGVTVDLPNDTTLATGDVNVGDVVGATSTLTLSGNAVLSTPNRVMTGMNAVGANGAIMVSGTSQFNMTGGWLSVGQTGGGSLTVKDSGTFSMTGSDFNITDLGNSTGTFNLQDSGTVNAPTTFWGKAGGTVATINISGGTFNTANDHYVASDATSSATVTQTGGTVNMNGGYNPMGRNGTAVWNLSAGTVNSNGWSIVGRDGTGIGTLNVSGGVFNQTQVDRPLMIGEFGSGTLTVSGTGEVNSNGDNGLILANEPAGTGVVNLDGGTLTVKRVREGNDGNGGNGGTSTFHFNGGVLKAAVGANANFLSGLTSAVVDAGGAFIDTNGQTVAIGQALDDNGGDLTKQGAGTLQLNGANSYFGTTTVAAGTLAGTGSVTGPLVVSATGSIAPGIAVGTFTGGDSASIAGSYVCEINGATADNLVVSGALTIVGGAVLDFNELAAPTAPFYIIASYASLSGTFTEQDVPAGYSVDYNYLGGNQIALVRPFTAYESWAIAAGLDPLTDGAAAVDNDGDGQSNGLEFALGGSPVSGSNNAKVYHLEEDSGDVGTAKELLLTIAVRSGAPAFAGSPSPTSTKDGATYTVQGSTDLATFTTAVSVVAPVTTGLPAAPAGYEYRTFSLDGSDGLPSKGFLRVDVTP